MTATAEKVRRHYENSDDRDMVAKVTQALQAFGDGPVTVEQLARLDQFHVRGLEATTELGHLAAITPGMLVLDAGSGIGGPSRYLAERYGCRVIGVDLAPSFVETAQLLARRTGLDRLVTYEVGNLLSLRFAAQHFDRVVTQHVVMNISDRAGLYKELRRVLKEDGSFAFYDILAGDNKQELYFPVPWAVTPETSHLLTKAETLAVLHEAGFEVVEWRDLTAESIESLLAQQQQTPPANGISLATVMGPRFPEMIANVGRNFRDGRIIVAMGLCRPRKR